MTIGTRRSRGAGRSPPSRGGTTASSAATARTGCTSTSATSAPTSSTPTTCTPRSSPSATTTSGPGTSTTWPGTPTSTATSIRFSFYRDLRGAGRGVRLVAIDSRCSRQLDPDDRRMVDAVEWAWIRQHVIDATHPFDHLVLASTLPWLMLPGVHHLEGWNEAISEGAWGRPGKWVGERVRQVLDLEHWAAFRESFDETVELISDVVRRPVATGHRAPARRRRPLQLHRGGRAHRCRPPRHRHPPTHHVPVPERHPRRRQGGQPPPQPPTLGRLRPPDGALGARPRRRHDLARRARTMVRQRRHDRRVRRSISPPAPPPHTRCADGRQTLSNTVDAELQTERPALDDTDQTATV